METACRGKVLLSPFSLSLFGLGMRCGLALGFVWGSLLILFIPFDFVVSVVSFLSLLSLSHTLSPLLFPCLYPFPFLCFAFRVLSIRRGLNIGIC